MFKQRQARFNRINALMGRGTLHMKDPENGQGGGGHEGEGDDDATSDDANDESGGDDDAGDGKTGGKSGTSDAEAKLLKDVMKQKAKAKELESTVARTNSELTSLKSIVGDLKPEDLKALVDSKKDNDRKQMEEQGKYEQIVEQMKTESNTALASMKAELEAAQTALTASGTQIQELTIGRAFSDSAYIRESSTMPPSVARRQFADHFEFENGQLVPYNKPRGTEGRAPVVDVNGENKSFEAAIEYLHTNHPDSKSLIRTKQKAGAGSDTTATGQKGQEQESDLRGVGRIARALSGAQG